MDSIDLSDNFLDLEDYGAELLGIATTDPSYKQALLAVRDAGGNGLARLFEACAFRDPTGTVIGFKEDMLLALRPLVVEALRKNV